MNLEERLRNEGMSDQFIARAKAGLDRLAALPRLNSRLVITPGVRALIDDEMRLLCAGAEMLRRHLSGDWGDETLPPEDWSANDHALVSGARLLSAHFVVGIGDVWIITDAENDEGFRECTTILLPSEY